MLAEEDIGNDECCYSANKIAEEATSYRMASVLDTYTAEIYSNDIERGICGALQYAT